MSAEAFFRLFSGLPRQGPGQDASTREALRRLPPLPEAPRVLDLGCGSGRQTLVLAEGLKVPIAAVDSHAPFLAQLETEAERRGLRHLIQARCADFGQLADAPGSYDVLWAEGSIYNLGWKEGLARWRHLLAPAGLMAATEATWLTDARPPEAVAFWKEAYPSMGTLASNIAVAQEAGYQVLDTFPLPPSAWWDEYYRPLQVRMDGLRAEAASDPALAEALAATRREIDVYAHAEGAYGYVFYLLRAS
ncbi:serine/threonine-protein kinase HipA [Stigmatella aurantiaca]|uniref:Serine/threonine-protein kinase HipA n=1 Tax=Stigmatella aurantiaca TaxID=41 RepID=A0A1H7GI37_STIAU|nr:class I SAM-dependent methyltransferase [Stigmatella aurantiaca]SEK37704.1 serine/threonine-protein kinase HipA [Stigmatella aurantiaca]